MTDDELKVLRAIKAAAPDGGTAPLQEVVAKSGLQQGRVLRVARDLQDQELIMMDLAGSMSLSPYGEGEV